MCYTGNWGEKRSKGDQSTPTTAAHTSLQAIADQSSSLRPAVATAEEGVLGVAESVPDAAASNVQKHEYVVVVGTLAVTHGIADSSVTPAAADMLLATLPNTYGAAVVLAFANPNLLPMPASVDAKQAYEVEASSVLTAVPTWP